MLQQPAPEDFVLATGETHPVREFVEKSFTKVGIELRCIYSNHKMIFFLNHNIRWEGAGEEEHAIDVKTGKSIVKVDTRYFRPAEVEYVFFFFFSCGTYERS
jgi:GDPmannose 4,6-dehydratase